MNVGMCIERVRESASCRNGEDAELLVRAVLGALAPLVPWPAAARLARELPAEWIDALRSARFDDAAGRAVFEARLAGVGVRLDRGMSVLRALARHLDGRARHALAVGLPEELRAPVLAA